MTRRQTRLFAIGSSTLAAVVFLALTVHSHTQFGRLTNAQDLTPQVVRGKDVWHRYNCVNCHTLFGEGAYYAPDLTKIAQQRGEPYLRAYLRNPASFYDEQRHRRLMPTQNLSEDEIGDLIAFLGWVSRVDNQGWPPRPILVTGAAIPGTDRPLSQDVSPTQPAGSGPPGGRPVEAGDDPIALGQALFRAQPPGCFACHSMAPGVNLVGPSLAGLVTRAQERIGSPDYHGAAKTPQDYIRESILTPNAYLVPGPTFSANGQSFMPPTYAKDLSPQQVDQLVAFLESYK